MWSVDFAFSNFGFFRFCKGRMSANWVVQISMRSRESKAVVVGVVPKYGSSKCVPCIFRFLIIFIIHNSYMIIIENEKSTDQISIRHALKGTLGSLGSLWDFSSKSETDLFFLKISLFPKKKSSRMKNPSTNFR